jgi:hypothetical protein
MAEEDPNGYGALVAALKSLPPDAEISWTQHHQDYFGVLTGYVDVYAPIVCDPAGLSRGWTVRVPEVTNREIASPTIIEHPGIWTAWMAYEPEADFPMETLRALFVSKSATGKGSNAPVVDHLRKVIMELPEESALQIAKGWEPVDISRIVQNWIAEHTGRTDLTLVYDASVEDPLTAELQDRIESIKGGETVQIGDGVFAHPEVMDQLLAMSPEEAAAVTEAMQKVRDGE